MALAWHRITEDLNLGGYAAWEAASEAALGGPERLVPVMARLVPAGAMDLDAAIAATLALTQAEFSRHERDLLETERAHAGPGWPHEVRFVAYAPRSLLADPPAFWEILGVGPGFLPAEAPPPPLPARDLAALAGTLAPDRPVLALIDEGIGYLNARFRAAPGQSRFLGMWLQATERLAVQETGPWGDIRLGRVLTADEINAQLRSGLTEAEVYAQANRALYPPPDRAATARAAGHGTHVLDLAAGAGFTDPMAACPILAVQLPPASIRETAGRRMEAHLVQGLRWILAEVLRLADGTRVPPVVVNLSLGSLAGPGDRSEFLADWIGYEIERHCRLAPGAELRLTGAYGNSRLSRLAARAEARIRHPVRLDWRILPDDRTASFLELRVDQTLIKGLSLRLEPPRGSGLPSLEVDWPAGPPKGWRIDDPAGRGPVAAAVFCPEGSGQALCHLAIAPTRPEPGLSRAAPGCWRVELRSAEIEPIRVIARVQRDDTPAGHAPFGRQSWLDHQEGWTWDEESRSFSLPRSGAAGVQACPVTRGGTAVSYAGCARPEVYLVGAVAPGRGSRPWQPSDFSAEGARVLARPGESLGPHLSAPGEARPLLRGIRAAGVLSGSTARYFGTSMAAPAVARRLLDYFRTTAAADRSLAAEHAALVGEGLWADEADPRLGHGILAAAG